MSPMQGMKAPAVAIYQGTCPECQQPVIKRTTRGLARRYCSERCRLMRNNRAKRLRESRPGTPHAHRAASVAHVEPGTLASPCRCPHPFPYRDEAFALACRLCSRRIA